jgi:hypothetical protein
MKNIIFKISLINFIMYEDGYLRIGLRGVLWKPFCGEWSKRPKIVDSYGPPVTWHGIFDLKKSFSGSGEPPEVGGMVTLGEILW